PRAAGHEDVAAPDSARRWRTAGRHGSFVTRHCPVGPQMSTRQIGSATPSRGQGGMERAVGIRVVSPSAPARSGRNSTRRREKPPLEDARRLKIDGQEETDVSRSNSGYPYLAQPGSSVKDPEIPMTCQRGRVVRAHPRYPTALLRCDT